MHKVKMLFLVAVSFFLFAAGYRLLAVQPAQAQSPTGQEVAVLTGTLPDGGTIPLPHYADGTEAQDSECSWIVSPYHIGLSGAPTGGFPAFACFTEGRVVHVYLCVQADCSGSAGQVPMTANYMIVAVRNVTPTPTKTGSLGGGSSELVLRPSGNVNSSRHHEVIQLRRST